MIIFSIYPVSPSIACTVQDARGQSASRVATRHSIQLFVFLEEVGEVKGRRREPTSEHWRCCVALQRALRVNLERLVERHARKFRQAVHSALNKVVCNYGLHTKVG